MLQLWMFVYILFFQMIIDKNFQIAISLIKTRSPDDHQHHAFALYRTILYLVHHKLPDHWFLELCTPDFF